MPAHLVRARLRPAQAATTTSVPSNDCSNVRAVSGESPPASTAARAPIPLKPPPFDTGRGLDDCVDWK